MQAIEPCERPTSCLQDLLSKKRAQLGPLARACLGLPGLQEGEGNTCCERKEYEIFLSSKAVNSFREWTMRPSLRLCFETAQSGGLFAVGLPGVVHVCLGFIWASFDSAPDEPLHTLIGFCPSITFSGRFQTLSSDATMYGG